MTAFLLLGFGQRTAPNLGAPQCGLGSLHSSLPSGVVWLGTRHDRPDLARLGLTSSRGLPNSRNAAGSRLVGIEVVPQLVALSQANLRTDNLAPNDAAGRLIVQHGNGGRPGIRGG